MENKDKHSIDPTNMKDNLYSCIDEVLEAFGIYSAVRDDTGSIVDFRIEYVNAAACELNQMSREQQIGRLLCEILPAHKETELFEEYCSVVETGIPLQKESYIYEDVYEDGKRLKRAFDINVSRFKDGFAALWRDVTENVRHRIQSEQNQQQIADLVKVSIEGIVVLDGNGVVIFANPAADAMLGKPSGGTIGYPLGYPAVENEPYEITISREDSFTIIEMRTAETIWEGKPAFVVNLHDVTDIKKAEKKLRESEERYRTLFETMSQGVVYHDTDGEVISANPAARLMLELPIEGEKSSISKDRGLKWIREDGSEFPDEEHPSKVALATCKQVYNVVMGIHNPIDETLRWIEVTAIPQFRSGEKQPCQVYSILEDITARKQAFDQAQHLAAIVRSTQDAVISKDLEGFITSWNSSAERMYGYSAMEAIGRNISILIPENMEIELYGVLEKIGKGLTVGPYETVRRTKGGKQIDVSLTISPIRNEDENVIGASTIARDVTEERKARQEIALKTQELAKALTVSTKRERETRMLLDGARAVLDSRSFESAARRIFDAACDVTGAMSGYVALLSDDGAENEVLFLESGGLPCDVDPQLPMPVRGLRAEAYYSGKTVWENDFMNSKWVEFMPPGHVEMRNVLFAPLAINGKVVGIMGLANKPVDFTRDDAKMAGAFADLAAIVLRRTRSEDLLLESEKHHRFLAENILDVIWTMNLDLEFTYVNPACFTLTGYTPEEWIGSRLPEHCDEENFAKMGRIIADEMAKGTESSGVIFEAELIKKKRSADSGRDSRQDHI